MILDILNWGAAYPVLSSVYLVLICVTVIETAKALHSKELK